MHINRLRGWKWFLKRRKEPWSYNCTPDFSISLRNKTRMLIRSRTLKKILAQKWKKNLKLIRFLKFSAPFDWILIDIQQFLFSFLDLKGDNAEGNKTVIVDELSSTNDNPGWVKKNFLKGKFWEMKTFCCTLLASSSVVVLEVITYLEGSRSLHKEFLGPPVAKLMTCKKESKSFFCHFSSRTSSRTSREIWYKKKSFEKPIEWLIVMCL